MACRKIDYGHYSNYCHHQSHVSPGTMFRPNRYLIITLVVAFLLFAAENSALAVARAEITQSVSTDATDITSLIPLVAARGLPAVAMPDANAIGRLPSPLPGSSVSESLVTLANTGEQVSTVTTWSEPLGAGLLEFQETAAVSGTTTVEYWVFGSDHRRCLLNGAATYGQKGYLLSSNFWRNDRQPLFGNSPALPNDIFPSRIPPSAVWLSLNNQKPGGTGKLDTILGRYGYMTFDLWAQDVEQIKAPAGSFRTLKVIMRVNADSVLKYWPQFLRRLAQPFFPQNILYYDTAEPHRLVKFVGSFGYLAPQVIVETTRVYVAPPSAPGAE
jgi:hypothetical protein